MFDRRSLRWIAPATAAVLLAGAVITWLAWPDDAGPPVSRPGFLLSYAGATDRLARMNEQEAVEQLRDWARTGLAADLELDTAKLVEIGYDTLPVRDDGFGDLARQPVGPGRSLFADGVLHLLVPRDDSHRDRTIGLLLDQYRTDAGADPPVVQLHPYTIRPDLQAVHVEADQQVATGEFRRSHGYVRARIDSFLRLHIFLAATRTLSTIELVGGEVWAGGWRWPASDGQRLSRADVAVLQRGYDSADEMPAFSLDPGPIATVDDLAAIAPGLDAALLDGMVNDSWAATPFTSVDEFADAVGGAVFGALTEADIVALGLPADRAQLWALRTYLRGLSPYGQARYDGELQGTEIGMTLFYTDYVAKDWVAGVGEGVPTDAVKGFQPDSEVETPWSHCETGNEASFESGRLWFGQNEAAYSFQPDRISIGAQPTRLFTKSDGLTGAEVESSYAFGRGLRWWDQHYQEVADYETQYQRLDQIMRWSAALEWLGEDRAKLPSYADVDIRDDLRFADWYRGNDTLRERAPIAFVTPPSAEQESVLTTPSPAYEDCGGLSIRGGVSLGDLQTRMARAGRTFKANVLPPLRRGGLYDETSMFDQATGAGTIRQVSIDERGVETSFRSHTFSRGNDGTARVEIEASPRRASWMGRLKVWRDPTAPRSATLELRGDHGQVSQQVRHQDHDLGGLTAEKHGELVTLRWRSGMVDRMRNAVESIQDRIMAGHGNAPVDGALYGMPDDAGRMVYRIGGTDEPWFSISFDAPAGTDLAFRLQAPGPDGPQSVFATLVDHAPRPSDRWLKLSAETPDSVATAAEAPPTGARSVLVTTRDGRTTRLYPDDDGVRFTADDPILGLGSPVEGAALLASYSKVAVALREAQEAGDGLLRGVMLDGDGVALAGSDGVRLAAADDPWAHQVAHVSRPDQASSPRFALIDDHLLHQAKVPLAVVPGTRRADLLGNVMNENATVLIHQHLRATLAPANGPVSVDVLPRDTEVVVVEARVTRDDAHVDTATQPDIWEHAGSTWWRVAGGAIVVGSATGSDSSPQTPTATASGPTTIQPSQPTQARILLVCAEDDADRCAA
jgi:hypothetical protein